MAAVEFQFEGETFTVSPESLNNYTTMKTIAKVRKDQENVDPVLMFELFEAVFDGKDEEYAERLGGSIEKMGFLFAAAIEAVNEAKNS